MNGYNLSRNWYSFKFENSHKVKAIHSDMYFYIIDLWNRLGQKENIGLPTVVTMECLGIGSYNTYKKTLNDLIDFGFIKLIKDSKNGHSSKIIALSKFDKATDKATDKALDKASIKASDEASDTIDKQVNKETIKQRNKETIYTDLFDFKNELIKYGANENLVKDWLLVRKNKKASNTKTALNSFLKQVENSGMDIDKVLEMCVYKSWVGFESKWVKDEIKQTEPKYFKFYNHLLGKEVQEPIPDDLILKYGYKYTWDYSLKKVCQIPA